MFFDTEKIAILFPPVSRQNRRKLILEVKTKTRELGSSKPLRTYETL